MGPYPTGRLHTLLTHLYRVRKWRSGEGSEVTQGGPCLRSDHEEGKTLGFPDTDPPPRGSRSLGGAAVEVGHPSVPVGVSGSLTPSLQGPPGTVGES